MDNAKYTLLNSPALIRTPYLAPEVLQKKFIEYGFVECKYIAFFHLYFISHTLIIEVFYILLVKRRNAYLNNGNGSDCFSGLRCIVHNSWCFLMQGESEI